MEILALAVNILCGAVGGNIGGALLRNLGLGPMGNSVIGAIGGGLGYWLLGSLALMGKAAPEATTAIAGLNIGAVLGTLAGGTFCGIVLVAIACGVRALLDPSRGRGA